MTESTEYSFISLTPNFRVCRSDLLNLELQELRSVSTKKNRFVTTSGTVTKWVSVGFFSSLSLAVNKALMVGEKNLLGSEKMDLESVLLELQNLSNELKKSVQTCGLQVTDFVKKEDKRGKHGVTSK